ncbi:hypothetical protein D6850_08405 [Roseovarius spongiae]|uniref:Uncharacterized protein n=1 Tax=Roseovarius spongiae TaxID=2320272 RepID=A0A3A8B9K5_9RHOB|nr:hypothetical protein [Roseovarius spongiae]RKF14883.1 hypothetical protein D6850_08405 [Roseovarius spongiae]
MSDTIERMNYFQFQQVGAEDFRLEQLYHRDARARHDLGPHSWGIVQGCEIVETEREGDAGFVDIKLLPGMAVDGFGRRIHLLDPLAVPPELFSVFNSERLLELWLHYDEESRRDPDDERTTICIGDTAFSRVVETHRLIVGTLSTEHDPLIVSGLEAKPALADGTADGDAPILPADKSLPTQDFPDPRSSGFWPIRLGSVRWDGTVGKFRPVNAPEDLMTGRVHAGFIGASLLAEGGELRIAPRAPHPDGPDEVDFATLEGRMTVEGRAIAKADVFLHGGMLSFQSDGGSDETVPLTMRRVPDASGSGADLRVQIGEDAAADNARMTIGTGLDPYDSDPAAVALSVRADGMVDLPVGRLRFTETARQAIDLGVPSDPDASMRGIGWQGPSVYARTGNSFYWYHEGEHDPAAGNPGTDGELLMRLTSLGALEFGQEFRQALNFDMAGQSSGIGVQDETLYFRSDGNFAWYRGGAPDDSELNSGGGATAMSLDGSSRLTVEGGLRSHGRVELYDQRLAFLDSAGGDDGDPLEIYRHHVSSNSNHLRVRIGNDSGGGDRFVVGPDSGGFTEQFWVDNRGDAFFGRDVEVTGELTSQGQDVLFDVIAGEVALNRTGAGSGTHNLVVTSSRLSSVGSAQLMVGLSDIGNSGHAIGARWRVHYQPGTHSVSGGDTVTFPVQWRVDDSDGRLTRFSYVAILMP